MIKNKISLYKIKLKLRYNCYQIAKKCYQIVKYAKRLAKYFDLTELEETPRKGHISR